MHVGTPCVQRGAAGATALAVPGVAVLFTVTSCSLLLAPAVEQRNECHASCAGTLSMHAPCTCCWLQHMLAACKQGQQKPLGQHVRPTRVTGSNSCNSCNSHIRRLAPVLPEPRDHARPGCAGAGCTSGSEESEPGKGLRRPALLRRGRSMTEPTTDQHRVDIRQLHGPLAARQQQPPLWAHPHY
jgi:hypothetical protein